MKTKPILFSTPMVQAFLEGRKTQTRRIVKDKLLQECRNEYKEEDFLLATMKNPINAGDILWVRETWVPTRFDYMDMLGRGLRHFVKFKADNDFKPKEEGLSWKPSIHMPKAACRIFLEVTNVRVERLQDISEKDAINEGVERISDFGTTGYKDYIRPEESPTDVDAIESFYTLWCSINGRDSLTENPWVWVYDFKRVEKPKNF